MMIIAIIGIVIAFGGLYYSCGILTQQIKADMKAGNACHNGCLNKGAVNYKVSRGQCFCVIDGKAVRQ